MEYNVEGHIRSTQLPTGQPLLPVFEAVVNSLHAIEESGVGSGAQIEIRVVRQASLTPGKPMIPGDIDGFRIADNGVGFTEANFKAFDTAYTQRKAARGGKGIGRFCWLKAFDRAKIESTFLDDGKLKRRTFLFRCGTPPIESPRVADHDDGKPGTSVSLLGLENRYYKAMPKSAETIADRVLEHLLNNFLSEQPVRIVVRDEQEEKSIDLGQRFEELKVSTHADSFRVDSHDFEITLLRLAGRALGGHALHLCANHRPVLKEKLERYVPEVPDTVPGEEPRKLVLVALVSGDYLDRAVNAQRTAFEIDDSDEAQEVFPPDITMPRLRQGIREALKTLLQKDLEELAKARLAHVERIIKERTPQFRSLIKHAPDELSQIPANLALAEVDCRLYAIDRDMQRQTAEEIDSLAAAAPEGVDEEEYQQWLEQLIEKVTDTGRDRLVNYVSHRRLVLELLEYALRKDESGKAAREDRIHQLIFPMRATSDAPQFNQQNLWVIDEKLTYHDFLASDRPLSTFDLGIESQKRPDLVIGFDHPAAFTEEVRPFASVVLVEFKRPERADYGAGDDPVAQMIGYVRELQAGRINDRNGRTVRLDDRTRFYCYVVATLTGKMTRCIENYSALQVAGGGAFYWFNPSLRAYFEFIDYDTLLQNAQKRNRILFDKLGIPLSPLLAPETGKVSRS